MDGKAKRDARATTPESSAADAGVESPDALAAPTEDAAGAGQSRDVATASRPDAAGAPPPGASAIDTDASVVVDARGTADTAPVEEGLVGLWDFSELGGRSVEDLSGKGNRATFLPAGLQPRFGEGRVANGRALLLGKGGAHLSIARSATLDAPRTALTVAAWIRPTEQVESWAMIVSRRIGHDQAESYGLALVDGRPLATGETIGEVSASDEVKLNRWTHVAMTYDGRMMRLFVDGREIAATDQRDRRIEADDNPLIVSGNQNEASSAVEQQFFGWMDELRLYSKALSAAEVARLAAR